MMDRKQVEAAIKALYDSRLCNELLPCAERFAADARFELAGSAEASQLAVSVSGSQEIHGLLDVLMQTWTWERIDFKAILIDGNQAAVRYELTTLFTPTGKRVTTQIMDHVVFNEDGRASAVTEFVDTAMAQGLLEQASA